MQDWILTLHPTHELKEKLIQSEKLEN